MDGLEIGVSILYILHLGLAIMVLGMVLNLLIIITYRLDKKLDTGRLISYIISFSVAALNMLLFIHYIISKSIYYVGKWSSKPLGNIIVIKNIDTVATTLAEVEVMYHSGKLAKYKVNPLILNNRVAVYDTYISVVLTDDDVANIHITMLSKNNDELSKYDKVTKALLLHHLDKKGK